MSYINNLLEKIYKNIRIIVFMLLTILTLFTISSVLNMEIEGNIDTTMNNVGYSIIAAYIFYLINEVIPSIIQFYNNRKRNRIIMSIAYRKLQLLLVNLDGIFLEIYKDKNNEEYKGSLNEFYEINFLYKLLVDFDLSKLSNIYTVDASGNEIKLTYEENLNNTWSSIKRLAQDILNTQYILENHKLAYEVEFLISESNLSTYFKLRRFYNDHLLVHIFMRTIDNNITDSNLLKCIKSIHKIAFDMYDDLNNEKELRNIFPPKFYNE